jgi:hypothetical protein
LRTGEENGWESSGWELDVDFLFLAVKLMICSVENWRGDWMGVLWLGAGCGFSLFGALSATLHLGHNQAQERGPIREHLPLTGGRHKGRTPQLCIS